MSRGRCDNCTEPYTGKGLAVTIDGETQRWCPECAGDKREREAEVDRERDLGVYKGDGMGERSTIEYFEGGDGWYWRQVAANGEEEDRSSEGYSSKEHAEEGRARVEEQDAAREAADDKPINAAPENEVGEDEALPPTPPYPPTPEDAVGEVPENE